MVDFIFQVEVSAAEYLALAYLSDTLKSSTLNSIITVQHQFLSADRRLKGLLSYLSLIGP